MVDLWKFMKYTHVQHIIYSESKSISVAFLLPTEMWSTYRLQVLENSVRLFKSLIVQLIETIFFLFQTDLEPNGRMHVKIELQWATQVNI